MEHSPIKSRDRIVSLDVIRGFALFGIFLVNMPAFQWPQIVSDLYFLPVELSEVDQWIRLVFDVFVQAKFYTIFSFLFGVGFYIFMKRAEDRGLNVYSLFSKRMAILALFGFLHLVLFWYGDILLTYALAGFFLLFFYRRSVKTILVWIFSLMVLAIILFFINFTIPSDFIEQIIIESQEEGEGKLKEALSVYEKAGYGEWLAYRWTNEVIPVLQNIPYAIPVVLFMFLLGLYAGKKGIFSHFPQHRHFVRRVWWISLIAGMPFCVAIVLLHLELWELGLMKGPAIQAFVYLSGIFLSLFYVATILFLLEKERCKRLLRPLGYSGRMALTNYIMQTLIGIGIFTGMDLFGQVNLLLGTFICLMIFPLQVLFSYFWLKRFHFGPLEWVWRRLTYGRKQPFVLKNESF